MAQHGPGGRRSTAKHLALCGIFSALAVILLMAGGLIPIGTFAAPIFAGICLLPIAADVGTKWALLCYVAVGALGAVLVPDVELVLFFIALLGYYPILRPTLGRIKNRALRWVVKLGLFNLAVAAVYAAMLLLFTSTALQQELAGRAVWFWAALLALGNLTFVLYDVLLDKVLLVYYHRVRRHLFK